MLNIRIFLHYYNVPQYLPYNHHNHTITLLTRFTHPRPARALRSSARALATRLHVMRCSSCNIAPPSRRALEVADVRAHGRA